MGAFRFRAPGARLTLAELLARAVPRAAAASLVREIRGGSVRVAGRVERDPACVVDPGARVAAELPEAAGKTAAPRLRLRGADFAVLESAPGGDAPDAALADAGDAPLLPVFAGDGDARSLWLVALGEAARDRLAASLQRSGAREARALIEAPPWRRGALEVGGGPVLGFEVIAEHEGVAEVSLQTGTLAPHAVRETLARAGAAVLGDARFGGRLVAGGLRLWSARLRIPEEGIDVSCEAPGDAWPCGEPVFAPEAVRRGAAPEGGVLCVSRATLRALARGHPWILTDTETGDAGAFRPGALVELRGPGAQPGGLARIEGDGPIAARLWSRGAGDGGSVEARVVAALARRRGLIDNAAASDGTDAFRLVHGEADSLPGLAIDRLGPCLRVLVTGRAALHTTGRAIDAVVRALAGALGADPPVVEVVHLRERPAGVLECTRLSRGSLDGDTPAARGSLIVRERGLLFDVDLGLEDPTRPAPGVGLFLDQRENRERVAARAAGGRWLNLFAHTGAFTAALLRAGAKEVVSVDLSAAWLRCLDATLARNGLDATRHRAVRGDSRRFFERLPGGGALRRHRPRSAHRGRGRAAVLVGAPRPRAAGGARAPASRAGRLPPGVPERSLGRPGAGAAGPACSVGGGDRLGSRPPRPAGPRLPLPPGLSGGRSLRGDPGHRGRGTPPGGLGSSTSRRPLVLSGRLLRILPAGRPGGCRS